jgi:hypothetical protein
MRYIGAFNSCIDFYLGCSEPRLASSHNVSFMMDSDYEGALKPLRKESFIRSSQVPSSNCGVGLLCRGWRSIYDAVEHRNVGGDHTRLLAEALQNAP